MSVSRVGQRRQVVIPQGICEEVGLHDGDFVEVSRAKGAVIIRPKKLVDADDVLTPEEEALVRKGEAQIRRGAYVTLDKISHDLDRPARKRGRQTA